MLVYFGSVQPPIVRRTVLKLVVVSCNISLVLTDNIHVYVRKLLLVDQCLLFIEKAVMTVQYCCLT